MPSAEYLLEVQISSKCCSDSRWTAGSSSVSQIQKPTFFLDAEYVVGALSRFYTRKGAQQGLEDLQEELGIQKKSEPGAQKPIDDLLRGLIR